LLWIDIAQNYPILGIRNPMTTVEWSDTSAAISISRSLEGMRNIYGALSTSKVHAKHRAELADLSHAIMRLENMQRNRRHLDDADMNVELVKRTFNPNPFHKVVLTLATILDSDRLQIDIEKVRWNFGLRSRAKRWGRRVLPRSIVEMLKKVAAWEYVRVVGFRKRASSPISVDVRDDRGASLRAAIRATAQGDKERGKIEIE